MSLWASSALSSSICAQIAFAFSSFTSEPRKMIRFESRDWYTESFMLPTPGIAAMRGVSSFVVTHKNLPARTDRTEDHEALFADGAVSQMRFSDVPYPQHDEVPGPNERSGDLGDCCLLYTSDAA